MIYKLASVVAWLSFYALWWLLLLKVILPSLPTLLSMVLFFTMGIFFGAPIATMKPRTGTNGHNSKDKRGGNGR